MMVLPEADPKKVLIITGPTAVGKTEFALHAASAFDGEILSCDSMQIYKGMDIGTAKPSKEEMDLIVHHLIDITDPAEDFSAATYSRLAREAIDEVSKRGKLPVVCGGTGLYLDGILYEMDYGKGPQDPAFREELMKRAEEEGSPALHEELKIKDPQAAEEIHPNNTKRLIRALERLHLGEDSLRSFRGKRRPNQAIDPLLIGLERSREELYERINQRVDLMIKEGLEEEVRSLLDRGLSLENPSMLGIGYKEMVAFAKGETGLEEAVEQIKTGTRHYAKRQFTWFKRYDKMKWINLSEYGSGVEAMEVMDEMIREWLGSQR